MDNALDTGDGALHVGDRGEVGLDEGLVRREIVRRLDVAQAEVWIDALEQLAQPRADRACCARDEDCLHLQLPILRGVIGIAELRGESLIALAAVEQMPAHGGTRLHDSTFADRTHDRAMFLLEYLAVDAPGQPRAAGDGLTRDDEASEMLQEAPELWIAGGIRDAAMKRKILIDRVIAALERAVDHTE